MIAIKSYTIQQDNKWSTKTEEMEYKMKCMEKVAKLKRVGWSNGRIGKLFPNLGPFLYIPSDDHDDDEDSIKSY